MSFQSGRVFDLVWLIGIIAFVLYMIRRARTDPPEIRRIPALDAIEDVIGRATEMGRPIICHQGSAALSGSNAAITAASLEVLAHVAHQCAQLDTALIVPSHRSMVVPLLEDVVRTAYTSEGKAEVYASQDIVRYLVEDAFVMQAAMAGLISRDRPVAYIGIGPMGLESQTNIMNMARIGGVSICGAQRSSRMPDMACADYSLFAADIFATSAYLSKNPTETGSVAAQDITQIVLLGLLILGLIVTATGSQALVDLFKL